ncbi:unnamed protein product [Heligmosomoides polygyrus]|uniref:TonB-dependent receptor n=1 Tax=Heligmosomoides polygyrus TaxID=6339 RepID=A0A183G6H5_HELPZ|nr:unnamed protein product [Heligmosomoides polygyrus]
MVSLPIQFSSRTKTVFGTDFCICEVNQMPNLEAVEIEANGRASDQFNRNFGYADGRRNGAVLERKIPNSGAIPLSVSMIAATVTTNANM